QDRPSFAEPGRVAPLRRARAGSPLRKARGLTWNRSSSLIASRPSPARLTSRPRSGRMSARDLGMAGGESDVARAARAANPTRRFRMFLRVDRLQVELPMPSEPDPNAAANVQELLGGRFGEMSTLMNYTYQSFNFRGRNKAKPFYDLIANIATEELGHIELVAAVINGLLTGASDGDDIRETPLKNLKDAGGLRHHYINTGFGALVTNANGQGWNGEYV